MKDPLGRKSGVCFLGYHLAWIGYPHGHLNWLPYRMKLCLVYLWNLFVCSLVGHSDIVVYPGEDPEITRPHCGFCCREVEGNNETA